jgi:hypothetical protein
MSDDPSIFGSFAETFMMDTLQNLLDGGRGFDTIKLGHSWMVSSLILGNHDFCSISKFSHLSKRGKAFSTLHLLISNTLKLEFKPLTELEKHISNFGISINTSSFNEGINNFVTSSIFLSFKFVRKISLSRDGSG